MKAELSIKEIARILDEYNIEGVGVHIEHFEGGVAYYVFDMNDDGGNDD